MTGQQAVYDKRMGQHQLVDMVDIMQLPSVRLVLVFRCDGLIWLGGGIGKFRNPGC